MKRQHYRSDLTLKVSLSRPENSDGGGGQVAIPEHVRLEFFVPDGRTAIIAERNGDKTTLCKLSEDGMSLEVFLPFSRRPLGIGDLMMIVTEYSAAAGFPDDIKEIHNPSLTGVQLWKGVSDGESSATAEAELIAWRYGYSAYELAKIHGFTGTEEEFVAGLLPVSDTVKYSSQTLSDDQQKQARSNIGALSDANGAVKAENIADGAVTTGKIKDGSIDTSKIMPKAITEFRLGDSVVSKLNDNVKTTKQNLTAAEKTQARKNLDIPDNVVTLEQLNEMASAPLINSDSCIDLGTVELAAVDDTTYTAKVAINDDKVGAKLLAYNRIVTVVVTIPGNEERYRLNLFPQSPFGQYYLSYMFMSWGMVMTAYAYYSDSDKAVAIAIVNNNVDSEVIKDSGNPITSGCVYNALRDQSVKATSVLQEIDLTGTDEDRKAALDKFEEDWKALTGSDSMWGARFVARLPIEIEGVDENCTVLLRYNQGGNYEGSGLSNTADNSICRITVSSTGSLTITPLFSHLEAITIYTDNSAASRAANVAAIKAYVNNLVALGVDMTKGYSIPVMGELLGTIAYNPTTKAYTILVTKGEKALSGYILSTGDVQLETLQLSVDKDLQTTSHMIVGAINELNTAIKQKNAEIERLTAINQAVFLYSDISDAHTIANSTALGAYLENLSLVGVKADTVNIPVIIDKDEVTDEYKYRGELFYISDRYYGYCLNVQTNVFYKISMQSASSGIEFTKIG